MISSPVALSLSNNQMLVSYKDESGKVDSVPIEDVGIVILDNSRISITMPLVEALSNNNVSVVFCDSKRMPTAMLQNLSTNTNQCENLRAQIDAGVPLKKKLWKQIIESKIKNQSLLLKSLGIQSDDFKLYYNNVKSGDSDNREGVAAKLYWDRLFGKEFMRDRKEDGINSLLNYGYTVLRAATARAIMGSGLYPAIGLFHRHRSNAFPLADDLMEPFRPFVDAIVFSLRKDGFTSLTSEAKSALIKTLYCDTLFQELKRPLIIGLSMTTSSLSKCYSGEINKLCLPVYV